jgi:hypothetical protein
MESGKVQESKRSKHHGFISSTAGSRRKALLPCAAQWCLDCLFLTRSSFALASPSVHPIFCALFHSVFTRASSLKPASRFPRCTVVARPVPPSFISCPPCLSRTYSPDFTLLILTSKTFLKG